MNYSDPPVLREFTGTTLKDRVDLITQQVYKSIRDPITRVFMAQMIRECPERDDLCDAKAIYYKFKERYRYTPDPYQIDLFPTIRRAWLLGGGSPDGDMTQPGVFMDDCDGACIILCSVYTHAGFRAGYKVIAPDGKTMSHIYPVIAVPRTIRKGEQPRVLAADATVRSFSFGEEPPAKYTRVHKIYWYAERNG